MILPLIAVACSYASTGFVLFTYLDLFVTCSRRNRFLMAAFWPVSIPYILIFRRNWL